MLYAVPTPRQVTAALKRYALAVENKAFDGTIPWDSEEACEAHAHIDKELEAAEHNLRRLILTTELTQEKK